MKLVIDIPDEIYKSVKTDMWCGSPTVGHAILNGTPLEETLEKIKAEIRGRCRFSINKIDVLDIIDNHISELKGENS